MQITSSLAVLLLALVCSLGHTTGFQLRSRRTVAVDGKAAAAADCQELVWYPQLLDHYSRHKDTDGVRWKQRVIICRKYWRRSTPTQVPGPIFFYAGNEADVMLYVNATGLIWENAERFQALIVFAEHRYYGASEPFGPDSWKKDPSYLTTEQALADYASLIWHIKHTVSGTARSPVIVFGGSYGGLLAAWMRIKYPHLVTGAIAASAPLLAFPGVLGYKPSKFWEVVTYDATPAAGSDPACVNNTRSAFRLLLSAARLPQPARATVGHLMRLCKELQSPQDVLNAAYWVQGAFDAFAMGNYPWPSSYISGDPEHPLPAWPMRAACHEMTKAPHMSQSALLQALADAAGLMYNATGQVQCFEVEAQGPAAGNTGPWDFQVCTEQMSQEVPYFPSTGVADMFWNQTADATWQKLVEHCKQAWGVAPERFWAATEYGGAQALRHASNIVLSNGLMDPWSAFGVLRNISASVQAVIIPDGAHHVDLMFSHKDDTPTITHAREVELMHIERWVSQYHAMHKSQPGDVDWEAGAAHMHAPDDGNEGWDRLQGIASQQAAA